MLWHCLFMTSYSVAHSWECMCTSCSCWEYTLPKRDDFIDSTLVRKIVLLVRTDASHNHFFLVCPPNKNRYMLNAFLSGSWLKQMFFLHFSAGKSRCIGRVFSFCIFYWVKLLNLGVSFVGLFWSDGTHVDKYKKLWGQFIYKFVIVLLFLKFFWVRSEQGHGIFLSPRSLKNPISHWQILYDK